MNWIATPRAAALVAVVCGLLYAGLAGFSLPTQRALVMLVIFMGSIFTMRQIRPFRGLMLALLIVLLLDPRAGLSPGFWMSFLAVSAILVGMSWRVGRHGPLWVWTRAQWLVAIGLTPVLLAWQQQAPLIAPLVNLAAVPLFSLVIIPFALGGTLMTLLWVEAAALVLIPVQWLLNTSYTLLLLADGLPFEIHAAPGLPWYAWCLAAIGTLIFLLPQGIPGRWLGVTLLLPMLLLDTVRDQVPGDFRFDLLDVGQGMAAVIQTRHHLLVYDTGPRFSSTFDAGSAVLVPMLLDRGVKQIDRVIVSNGDNDHKGGLAGLLERFPVTTIISGEAGRIDLKQVRPCVAGDSWQWDGVSFTILHPEDAQRWKGNDASCVLLVENAAGRLLITGDIEAAAESRLLDCCARRLSVDLVTIPHHGSNTSSTAPFIRAVGADIALASSGYRNRYGFPRDQVVDRWKRAGAEVFDTASSGAIGFVFSINQGLLGPSRYREQARRYWTHGITHMGSPSG